MPKALAFWGHHILGNLNKNVLCSLLMFWGKPRVSLSYLGGFLGLGMIMWEGKLCALPVFPLNS